MLKILSRSALAITAALLLSCGQTQTPPTTTTAAPTQQPPANSGSATPATSGSAVNITAPKANEQVIERPLIEGTADPKAKEVWVIVHPMEVADYWVQPRVTLEATGKWAVQGHLGRPGSTDNGKLYELMAIANPSAKLNEGDRLKNWPEAAMKSQIVRVTRK